MRWHLKCLTLYFLFYKTHIHASLSFSNFWVITKIGKFIIELTLELHKRNKNYRTFFCRESQILEGRNVEIFHCVSHNVLYLLLSTTSISMDRQLGFSHFTLFLKFSSVRGYSNLNSSRGHSLIFFVAWKCHYFSYVQHFVKLAGIWPSDWRSFVLEDIRKYYILGGSTII